MPQPADSGGGTGGGGTGGGGASAPGIGGGVRGTAGARRGRGVFLTSKGTQGKGEPPRRGQGKDKTTDPNIKSRRDIFRALTLTGFGTQLEIRRSPMSVRNNWINTVRQVGIRSGRVSRVPGFGFPNNIEYAIRELELFPGSK